MLTFDVIRLNLDLIEHFAGIFYEITVPLLLWWIGSNLYHLRKPHQRWPE